LLAPSDPVVVTTDPIRLHDLATAMAAGTGPVALDAERASGYRYGSRAYLVQLRRADVGTHLLDPVALGDLAVLQPVLGAAEWVLHAASQDLPCLADVGLTPSRLFDTELAARLAGYPRVGLGPLVEQVLGLALQKGHGAADWSARPLPHELLVYAALDVEVLVDLRDALAGVLRDQGKWEWAQQEFAALAGAPAPAPRIDPWRRTSGIHKVHDRLTLAVIRALWEQRDELAHRRDLAPHRVLPDAAIIAAATARPRTVEALVALPVFGGRMQRRQASVWLAAIGTAMALPERQLPPVHLPGDGPPAAGRWASKDPAAAARLSAARAGLAQLSERWTVPVENLMSPDLVRRTLWQPPSVDDLEAALTAGGARPWQVALVAPVLRDALAARAS
jgi:ribonuclease D